MAAADQIKSLIKSFGKGDEARFFATAMQIAASEARKGHSTFAKELKSLIDQAKSERTSALFEKEKVVSITRSKRELDELIEVIHPRIKLVDMVLPKQIESLLNRVVAEHRSFEQLSKHGLSPRRKLLLEGPPGCGKTMTTHALAGELGLSVFVVRLDGLISKFMGESIAKLRIIFDAMQSYKAVYLFDEFDSIGAKRNQGSDVGEIRRVLNSFLINIEKDTSSSLIIAATNLPDTLDSALFRRFDDIIEYPMPSQEDIIQVLKKHLRSFKMAGSMSLDELAEHLIGNSFAEIVRACEEAIKEMIISNNKTVSEKHVQNFLISRKRTEQ
ncbi:MAG: ATP-binding protein [Bacteroidetes bacterium]|nr:ATP-binding protein [Bacteroidota bacterium]